MTFNLDLGLIITLGALAANFIVVTNFLKSRRMGIMEQGKEAEERRRIKEEVEKLTAKVSKLEGEVTQACKDGAAFDAHIDNILESLTRIEEKLDRHIESHK